MAKINVRVRDSNRIPRLRAILRELKSYRIEVGIFGSDEYVMIANVHEFGATIRRGKGNTIIPERSFMRSTFDEKKEEWVLFFNNQLKRVLKGQMGPRVLCERLGAKMTADIQEKITDLDTPPNAPSTIAQKGSSNPLIDTGGLRMRVTWRVVQN